MCSRWIRLAAVLSVGGSIVSCASDEGSGGAGSVDFAAYDPVVVIGRDTVQAGHVLHGVTGAVRPSMDTMVIANEGTRQLRLYNQEGVLIGERGGAGSGPEEFLSMQTLLPFGTDSLVVWDPLNSRLSIWSTAGSFGRTVRLAIGATAALEGHVTGRRSVLTLQSSAPSPGLPAWQTYTDSLEVVVLDLDRLEQTQLGEFPASRKVIGDASGLGGPSGIRVPLPDGPKLAVATHEDRVYIGFPDGSPIRIFSGTGAAVGEITLPFGPRPRPDAATEAAIEEQMSAAGHFDRADYRRYLERFPQPEWYPAFDLFLVGPGGDLWFRHYPGYGEEMAEWTVVDSAGYVVNNHELPVRFTPVQIGPDWILGKWKGADDVEMVALLPLPLPQ